MLLAALLPAGCALSPQAAESVHPERYRAKRSALSSRAQYLQDCDNRIHIAWQRQVDRYWGARDRDERMTRTQGQPQDLVQAAFDIRADGHVENLDIQCVNQLSPESLDFIQAAFEQSHLPKMPPEVAAQNGGRLHHKLWLNDWVF